jgi:hypothetical protein
MRRLGGRGCARRATVIASARGAGLTCLPTWTRMGGRSGEDRGGCTDRDDDAAVTARRVTVTATGSGTWSAGRGGTAPSLQEPPNPAAVTAPVTDSRGLGTSEADCSSSAALALSATGQAPPTDRSLTTSTGTLKFKILHGDSDSESDNLPQAVARVPGPGRTASEAPDSESS